VTATTVPLVARRECERNALGMRAPPRASIVYHPARLMRCARRSSSAFTRSSCAFMYRAVVWMFLWRAASFTS
jgi:hypothetical protein